MSTCPRTEVYQPGNELQWRPYNNSGPDLYHGLKTRLPHPYNALHSVPPIPRADESHITHQLMPPPLTGKEGYCGSTDSSSSGSGSTQQSQEHDSAATDVSSPQLEPAVLATCHSTEPFLVLNNETSILPHCGEPPRHAGHEPIMAILQPEIDPRSYAPRSSTLQQCTCSSQTEFGHESPISDSAKQVDWTDSSASQDFYNDPGHLFWTWDRKEQLWFHRDIETGEILWCPRELD